MEGRGGSWRKGVRDSSHERREGRISFAVLVARSAVRPGSNSSAIARSDSILNPSQHNLQQNMVVMEYSRQ